MGISEGTDDGGWNSLEAARVGAHHTNSDKQEMEYIREVAGSRAHDGRLDAGLRKQWAKLSLQVNARMHGGGPWEQAHMAANSAWLRTGMIEAFGPDPDDADWDPTAVVSDLLCALTMTPGQARSLSSCWTELPIDQIGALRRIKNITAPLQQLIRHMPPGPLRDRALEWLALRPLLP
ncbi:hypothetical protein [Streptomyces sp. NPDC007369]|uniref:hypothetical protein n=1 Tax=Streptomyces sp. NPDC007369 TaxID=3154589 RepID=UPI0033C96B93